VARDLAHLFKPGNPGGPGRPKGSLSLTTILRNALKEKSVMNNDCPPGMNAAETLIQAAIWHAIKGNASFFQSIMDRVDGRTPDAVPDVSNLAEIQKTAVEKAHARKRNRPRKPDGPPGGLP